MAERRPTGASPAGAPQLTVIVPAWNAAATIGDALRSILADPDLPVECLVIDDGSTDETAAIVEAIAAADPRTRVIRLPGNEGVSAARNRGLDAARGAWIAFVDSDDRVVAGGLRALLRTAAERELLVLIGQRISTDGSRRWYPRLYDLPDIRRPGRKSIVSHPGLLYYAGPVGKLFHCSLVGELRFEGRMLGDQPWVLKALLRAGDRIEVVEDVVYEWWRPGRGRSRTSITEDRIRSARLGADATAMALLAHREVTAAFEEALPARQAAALSVAYLDRLIRSELAPQLTSALRRRDPAITVLVEALRDFLTAIPEQTAADSHAIADAIVRTLVLGWWQLPADARTATQALVDRLEAARPAGQGERPHGILAWSAFADGRFRRVSRSPWMVLLWLRAATSFAWSRLRPRLGLQREEVAGLAAVRSRVTG